MRLQIRPGLARAWRAPGRLQIGLDPRCGVVLDGLTTADEHVLAALEAGSHDLDRLHADGRGWGLEPERVDDLVRVLRAAGVLLPGCAPALPPRFDGAVRARLLGTARRLAVVHPETDGWAPVARRLASRVLVQGGGRVGLRVALTLAGAGVGDVGVQDPSPVTAADVGPGAYRRGDLGRVRSHAADDRLRSELVLGDGRAGDPAPGAASPTVGPPTVVVLVGSGALDPARYDPWLAQDVAHLAVVVREGDAVVGPFVRAGRGCCLRCVELYRADRDPEWPRVAAQVATGWDGPCDPALAEHVAALAVSEVLTLLDGRDEPATVGRTLEVGPGRSVPVLRGWPAHPRCGCLALPAAATAPVPLGAADGRAGDPPPDPADALRAPAGDRPSTMGG